MHQACCQNAPILNGCILVMHWCTKMNISAVGISPKSMINRWIFITPYIFSVPQSNVWHQLLITPFQSLGKPNWKEAYVKELLKLQSLRYTNRILFTMVPLLMTTLTGGCLPIGPKNFEPATINAFIMFMSVFCRRPPLSMATISWQIGWAYESSISVDIKFELVITILIFDYHPRFLLICGVLRIVIEISKYMKLIVNVAALLWVWKLFDHFYVCLRTKHPMKYLLYRSQLQNAFVDADVQPSLTSSLAL